MYPPINLCCYLMKMFFFSFKLAQSPLFSEQTKREMLARLLCLLISMKLNGILLFPQKRSRLPFGILLRQQKGSNTTCNKYGDGESGVYLSPQSITKCYNLNYSIELARYACKRRRSLSTNEFPAFYLFLVN